MTFKALYISVKVLLSWVLLSLPEILHRKNPHWILSGGEESAKGQLLKKFRVKKTCNHNMHIMKKPHRVEREESREGGLFQIRVREYLSTQ